MISNSSAYGSTSAAEPVEVESEHVCAGVHRGGGEMRHTAAAAGALILEIRISQPADAPHAAAELHARHRRAELPNVPHKELLVVAA